MDPSISADLEAPKDPGAFKPHASVTDNEILGKPITNPFTKRIMSAPIKCLKILAMHLHYIFAWIRPIFIAD